MPVTALDLIRTASWISKCASEWAGDIACDPKRAGEEMKMAALQRFRQDIMDRLDQVHPSKA